MKTQILLLMILLTLMSCATKPVGQDSTTSEPTPKDKPSDSGSTKNCEPVLGKKVNLWATFYYTPMMESDSSGYHMRDIRGNVIGGPLSLDKFCALALQGSGIVDGQMYNYKGTSSAYAVPCGRSFLGSRFNSSGRVKYYKSDTGFGEGNRSNPLVPYKSIACDQSIYPFGTLFYIPKSVSKENPTGIWRCDDVGGAIKKNHIDVFIGLVDMRTEFRRGYKQAYSVMPFKSWVKSKSSETFDAYIVKKENVECKN